MSCDGATGLETARRRALGIKESRRTPVGTLHIDLTPRDICYNWIILWGRACRVQYAFCWGQSWESIFDKVPSEVGNHTSDVIPCDLSSHTVD
jgi:hypothetical protein